LWTKDGFKPANVLLASFIRGVTRDPINRAPFFFSSENTANSLKRRSRKKGAGSLGTRHPANSFSSAGVARNTGHKVSFELAFTPVLIVVCPGDK
jgi:hypothetical protein